MLDSKLITAPDLDHSNQLKIMLIDFEWSEIEYVSGLAKSLDESITIYLYSHLETDHKWCMTAARTSNAILVNCAISNKLEFLKGFVLSLPQASAFSLHDQSFVARSTYHDIAVWLTQVIKYHNSQKRGQDGI